MTAEQAFETHHKAVYRFVYRLTGRADVAEDVTQDCFLAILRKPVKGIAEPSQVRTYLFAIARNLAFKRFRDEHGDLYVDTSAGWDEAPVASEQELSVVVAQMVARLPDLQREVLILFEYEGFALSEISEIVKADVGAVKARLHRARERLRRALAPYGKGVLASHENA